MKLLNKIIMVTCLVIMIFGLISLLFGNRPEQGWAMDSWRLFYIFGHLKAMTLAIIGAIGFFSELLYFNLRRDN